MKALVLEELGRMIVQDYPTPISEVGEVLIEVVDGHLRF